MLSASQYLSLSQLAVCPGPTGAVGPAGATGTTGPTGPIGYSTGLIYYFKLSHQFPSGTVTGPQSGYPLAFTTSQTPPPYPTAPNPNYTAYYGYYTQKDLPTPSINNLLGQFIGAAPTGVTAIPPGTWNFSFNAYSVLAFDGITPVLTSTVYVVVYKTASDGTNSVAIGSTINRPITLNNITDTPYHIMFSIPAAISILPTDKIYVEFYVSTTTTGTSTQFWTEGDSVSQVTTTFAPQSGPSGPPGASGATGLPGQTGPTGPAGTNGTTMPPGSITAYAGSGTPEDGGWVLCDGSPYSGNDSMYIALFSAIGTTYGVGPGPNGFRVPDLRQKFILGAGNVAPYNRGSTGGEETHLLTISEMPAHSHTITDPGHVHGSISQGTGFAAADGGNGNRANPGGSTTNSVTSITINTTGGGIAHNNMPPYFALNYIIKL